MPTYKYVAKDDEGREHNGIMKAESQEELIGMLRRKGLSLTDYKEKKLLGGYGTKKVKAKVKTDEMVIFTRQLSTMISAGIPLLESLEVLEEQQENEGFANVLAEVVDRVRTGNDFSESLAYHPKVFPKIYVSMIKAGEASGQLDVILVRLAEYQEASAKLKREIKSAMTYPVISLTMIFGITAFLLVFIIPQFEEIFLSLGVELPGITVLLLDTSKFLTQQGHFVLLGIIAIVVGLVFFSKTNIGRWYIDIFKLKMPVFGSLFQKVAVSRFARTFSTLIRSGVPILGALEIVAATSGNSIIEKAIMDTMNIVKQGESLAEPLSECWVFPPMVVKMISIGEKTGALETLLEKISEFYDQQISATVEALTSLIEPLMIGVMGFVVGGIVLAVFLPIFKLQSKLAGG